MGEVEKCVTHRTWMVAASLAAMFMAACAQPEQVIVVVTATPTPEERVGDEGCAERGIADAIASRRHPDSAAYQRSRAHRHPDSAAYQRSRARRHSDSAAYQRSRARRHPDSAAYQHTHSYQHPGSRAHWHTHSDEHAHPDQHAGAYQYARLLFQPSNLYWMLNIR